MEEQGVRSQETGGSQDQSAVILTKDLKFKKARVTTPDGKEVADFHAMRTQAALPPGDYIVEVDGNKLLFPATEGEVFEVQPQ